jgi:hyaluronoglucosaminidase
MEASATALPEIGTIEGFYGRPWSRRERADTISFLAPAGYSFYLHAPKADPFLRRRWREDHPPEAAAALTRLSAHCRDAAVRFGIGLSPYEVFTRFGRDEREALARKLAFVDDLRARDLALLFDDMRGGLPDLAERQAEVVAWAGERTAAERLLVCPTYYSDDPVLDRVFGTRPPDYLERLGALLQPGVEVLWTGEEVCSREFSPGHLRRVAERIGRRPFLWDNYPVNDGVRMSRHLHLRAFTGRPAACAALIAAHGVNPALQPTLARIPMLTLPERYRLGDDFVYGEAFARAAETVLGADLASRLADDLLLLQDTGLDRLGERADDLRRRWSAADHPAAREIVAWLDGAYAMSEEEVRTQ